jgi:hypothetical protein
VKRLVLLGLLGGLLTTNAGCGLFQAIFCYRPCVGGGDCTVGTGDGCDDGCGPTCGQAYRPVRTAACAPRCGRVGGDCSSCGDPCADPCGDGCYRRCWHRGPLSCVFALFTPGFWCGRSCGERYWGDFYSDSPDCWDPCDCYGNYTGGCRNCGGGQANNGALPSGEKIISQTDQAVGPAPRPAAQPHKAVKPKPEP